MVSSVLVEHWGTVTNPAFELLLIILHNFFKDFSLIFILQAMLFDSLWASFVLFGFFAIHVYWRFSIWKIWNLRGRGFLHSNLLCFFLLRHFLSSIFWIQILRKMLCLQSFEGFIWQRVFKNYCAVIFLLGSNCVIYCAVNFLLGSKFVNYCPEK